MPDYGMRVSRTNDSTEALKIYAGRITEQFLIQQWDYHVGTESYRDAKARLEGLDSLYKGSIKELFPEETTLPDEAIVENKFKNALHDHSRLASEGRGMPHSIPLGDREADVIGARVREAIHDTYWVVGRGKRLTRQLYMDLAGTGMMGLACYYNDKSVYPQYHRLNPRYMYPDVRNGELQSLVYVETLKERIAALEHPTIGLNDAASNDATVDFVSYYGPEEVVECFIKKPGKNTSDKPMAHIIQRWNHELERVPVAFYQLTSYDGVIRGLFDQLSGPMMVRNKIMKFMVDYLEQISHAPLHALNIENADEIPGPTTVYRHDPDADRSEIGRVAPAAPASTVWNLVSYMDDQENKEATQPNARVGQVPQSQASGSFVNSTQGTLTSVIIEMQEGMSALREEMDVICNEIDEKHLDVAKPLVRSVGKKKTYTPSKDINEWYYHTVDFGAGAGLDKLNTDNRVLNHISARLIDRGTGRTQIDYLDDSASIQEKIDAENIADALLQRFATDPNTPVSTLAQVYVLMNKDGKSLIEALNEVVPDMVAAEQAKLQPPAGAPGAGAPTPQEAAAAAAGGTPPAGAGQTPTPVLPRAPMTQVFANVGPR